MTEQDRRQRGEIPEPNILKGRKLFREIFYGPVTQTLRWQVNKKRKRLEEFDVNLEEIMSDYRVRLLNAYTVPEPPHRPDGRWRSQREVKLLLRGDPRIGDLKRSLLRALLRIENCLEVLERKGEFQEVLEIDLAPTPIEFLLTGRGGMSEASRQEGLYRRMVLANFEENSDFRKVMVGEGIRTVEQVDICSGELLGWLCTSRPVYDELERQMQRFYPDWEREVVFRSELPPEEAYRA